MGEGHRSRKAFPSTTKEPTPVVPVADRPSTHHTPAYFNNIYDILDVEGYVPRENILETGAQKVMLRKAFATAMHINFRNLDQGTEFVTASGSVEMPLGFSNHKVKFTLARGTPHMFTIEVPVTIVDTTAYDVLLGMEFITAVGGAHESYARLATP